MSRLTLRLPDTLHRQLEGLARNESVSLNQYIVFALTRQATLAYTVQPVPEDEISRQRAAYTALFENLGQASAGEVERILAAQRKSSQKKACQPKLRRRCGTGLHDKRQPPDLSYPDTTHLPPLVIKPIHWHNRRRECVHMPNNAPG